MKTIDEVMRAVHHCGLLTGFDDTYEYDGGCPYEDCSKCEQKRMLGNDILHYLKEYQAILPLVPSLINTALEVQKKGKTIG